MEYYLAVDNSPKGPFSVDQLRSLSVKPDDLVWAKGMTTWTKAVEVDELREELFVNASPTPPTFDSQRFADNNRASGNTETRMVDDFEECPKNYMWLAIISFIGIVPLAIVAVIKASMVKRLWSEGKHDDARKQSRSALKWALLSLIIGLPLTIFYYYNNPFMSLI